MRLLLLVLCGLLLIACEKRVLAPPSVPTPNLPVATPIPILGNPVAPVLTKQGHDLILEFEVGGKSSYNPHVEAPDWHWSGWTWAIGFDGHTNSVSIILGDWTSRLGIVPAKRLAAGHPYYGATAKQHLKEVADILVPWNEAIGEFDTIDVARTYAECKKVFKEFDGLRLNAQASLISLVFNRGGGMVGDNRKEMRDIRDAVPLKDYQRMANDLRQMKRIWIGTENEKGLGRRRDAESQLMLTP